MQSLAGDRGHCNVWYQSVEDGQEKLFMFFPYCAFWIVVIKPKSAEKEFSPVEGVTPGEVVIEEVVSYPGDEAKDTVVLRNIGGQTVDMTGWQLSDSSGVSVLTFGEGDCSTDTFLAPAAKLVLKHQGQENTCGLSFTVGFRYVCTFCCL